MVNLKALEAAINKVERIRDHEFCFEVDGTKICMMPLRPDQETEVQKYAQAAMEAVQDGQADQGAFADFMDRMRHASLAFSIVQIGELNLRDVEYIETGETDEHGNAISLPKWEAICNLIAHEWSRLMLSQVFGKFGEMLDRLELRAQKAVSFDPVDLEEEIDRTTRRLTDLRETKERIKVPTPDPVTRQQKTIADIDKQAEDHRNDIRRGGAQTPVVPSEQAPKTGEFSTSEVETSPEVPPEAVPEPSPQAPQGRPSAVPQAGVPRERPPQQTQPQESQEPPAVQASGDPQEPQPPQNLVDERGIMLPPDGDSFFDPADPGQAMEVETRRQAMLHQQHIARQRAQAEQEKMRQEMGMPTAQEQAAQMAEGQRQAARPNAVDLSSEKMAGGAVDSLRQAANLHNAVADNRAGSVRAGRPQQPRPQAQEGGGPAQLHGKPVYKMPAQTLERSEKPRQHGEPPQSPLKMNPTAGGRNPNFRSKGS